MNACSLVILAVKRVFERIITIIFSRFRIPCIQIRVAHGCNIILLQQSISAISNKSVQMSRKFYRVNDLIRCING